MSDETPGYCLLCYRVPERGSTCMRCRIETQRGAATPSAAAAHIGVGGVILLGDLTHNVALCLWGSAVAVGAVLLRAIVSAR
jgi:hypothetical protein